jgi:DNA-binding Lrp family transcriptional regulator
VSVRLSKFQKQLCNALQMGLPISKRPYAEIGESLDSDEETALEGTRELVKRRVIRRMGAVINRRATGEASTLVTARAAEDKLKGIVEAINELEGVSHNYLRKHFFNVWFTLRADSQRRIERVLRNLSRRFGATFYSLPIKRVFKLDVRFDAESNGRFLLPAKDVRINREKVKLDETDERILSGLDGGLEAVAQPYDFLCGVGLGINDVLRRISSMLKKGVIYRVGAVVDHHRIGFAANAMFVCRANGARAAKVGQRMAKLKIVSHCYERRPFEGWPYNIFAMMHGRSMGDIQKTINRFVKSEKIEAYELLPTVRELKKQRVHL